MKQLTIKELVENKEELIQLKKSANKYVDGGLSKSFLHLERDGSAIKEFAFENNEELGVLTRTICANTYLWMDSHGDVHVPGCFSKSLKERGQKAPHLHDHIFQLDARVGKPKRIYEQEISWKELGVDISGKTECLFAETEIRKSLNENVYRDYLNNEIDQHSVGMRYIKIAVAVNDEDYPSEYEQWEKWIDKIGNKELAESKGYFWVIYEAALIEFSAVLMGSNELTDVMGNKQPLLDTVKEPSKDTRLLDGLNALNDQLKQL